MVWIPGGSFVMGSDAHYPEEAPAHRVAVEGFWIDRSPVTNAQFRKFVKATGHVTVAEHPADPVTARKDDAPAANQTAIDKVAGPLAFSGGGGLIQTTSG
ncbi:formylglycine-generating enzyme family protein [Synechococcus sp. CS-1324]|uniref:formylglycine-generating enzyme family protein n=1 Tax=Synechococcus sp. CS-1324 TaxID=2847980 RepID=UPI00223ACF6B|nr:formylglycine-generating enzyme family protein [Synechococcus sp. CS-1324]